MEAVFSRLVAIATSGRQSLFGARVGQRWIFRSNSGCFGRDKLTDYSILWISLALLIMGIGMLMTSALGEDRTRDDQHLITAPGVIISVRVVERYYGSELRWCPEITYQYSVQGRQIVSSQLAQDVDASWRDRNKVNAYLKRYAPHSRVVVYYDPNKPTQSMLDAAPSGAAPEKWLGVLIIALALSILVIYDRLH
jgi:hypothetical protein